MNGPGLLAAVWGLAELWAWLAAAVWGLAELWAIIGSCHMCPVLQETLR